MEADRSIPPDNEPIIPPAPFAGREAVFARLQQYALDRASAQAFLVSGWEDSGKTAFLKQFNYTFDEDFIGVYVQPGELINETEWLNMLVNATTAMLDLRQLNIARLPESSEEIDPREWVETVYLPEAIKLIRPQRRLLWLIDDAETLLDAWNGHRLPDDHAEYLTRLLAEQPQLGIVLTLDAAFEDKLTPLRPLVDPTAVHRLGRLDQVAVQAVIEQFTAHSAAINEELIYQQTGGHPYLVQRYGEQLARETSDVSDGTVKSVTPEVYRVSQNWFRQIWMELSRDERLVLTAASSLLYADPLRPISPDVLETWLVETDYPMDMITIRSSIRSLEYREIIEPDSSGNGIRLTSELIQKWLLEHARINEGTGQIASPPTPNRSVLWRGAILVIILAIVLVLILSSLRPSNTTPDTPSEPTATLSN